MSLGIVPDFIDFLRLSQLWLRTSLKSKVVFGVGFWREIHFWGASGNRAEVDGNFACRTFVNIGEVNICNVLVRVKVGNSFAARTFVNICNVQVRVEVDSDFACRTDSQMCSLILQSPRFHHFPFGFDLGNLSDTILIKIDQICITTFATVHHKDPMNKSLFQ